jgi:hypothetical protein
VYNGVHARTEPPPSSFFPCALLNAHASPSLVLARTWVSRPLTGSSQRGSGTEGHGAMRCQLRRHNSAVYAVCASCARTGSSRAQMCGMVHASAQRGSTDSRGPSRQSGGRGGGVRSGGHRLSRHCGAHGCEHARFLCVCARLLLLLRACLCLCLCLCRPRQREEPREA